MVHIRIAFFVIAACFLKGNWRNWKAYYPTILLYLVGDTAFDQITTGYPFWRYTSDLLGNVGSDIFWGLIIIPCIVTLFLTYLPHTVWKFPFYILLCSAVYIVVEYIMYRQNGFVYFHGWNTLHSFLFDIPLFSILWLHYKKPLLAWLCILVAIPAFLLITGFPMDKIL